MFDIVRLVQWLKLSLQIGKDLVLGIVRLLILAMILDTLIAFGLTYCYRRVEFYASLDPPTFQKEIESLHHSLLFCILSLTILRRYFEISIKPRETASLMPTKHKASNNEEKDMEAENQEVQQNQKAEKTDHILAETSLRRRHSRKTLKEVKKEDIVWESTSGRSTSGGSSAQLPGHNFQPHNRWIQSIPGKRQLESPNHMSPTLRDSNSHTEAHIHTLQAPYDALLEFDDEDSHYGTATEGIGNAMVVYGPPEDTTQALVNPKNQNRVPEITEESFQLLKSTTPINHYLPWPAYAFPVQHQAGTNPGNEMVLYKPPEETAQAGTSPSNKDGESETTEESTPPTPISGNRDTISSSGQRRREEPRKRLHTGSDDSGGCSAIPSNVAMMLSETARPRKKSRILPASSRSPTRLRTSPTKLRTRTPVESPDLPSDSGQKTTPVE